MPFYSKQSYNGDGSTKIFTIPCPYIATSHIKVKVGGVEESGLTFPTTSTVELVIAPAAGTGNVLVYRETPRSSVLVDFEDGSIFSEDNLDMSAEQAFYISQEVLDELDSRLPLNDAETHWTAGSKKITDLSSGTVSTDAATVGQIESVATDGVLPDGTGHDGEYFRKHPTNVGYQYRTAAEMRTDMGLGALAVKATVAAGDIDNNSITNAKMADNSVDTAELVDGAVATNKLAGAAVTTVKIADDSVTTNKLGPDIGRLLDKKTYTAGATWVKPADLSFVISEVVGGGGGGGAADGSASNFAAAAGGTGGGYSRKKILAANLSATETVTVGSGGAGGTTPGNNGSTGGTSSFGAHCSATGGGGGEGAASGSSAGEWTIGGTPGVGSGGDENEAGHVGHTGGRISGSLGHSGAGGGSRFSGGAAAQRDTSAAGINASGHGAGGSGGLTNSATDRAGGNGSGGIVIVWEYA